MPDHTHQRAVLVTGATGGIGAATTRAFADRGFRVYAAARGPETEFGGVSGVRSVQLDVTDPESVQAAAAEIDRAEKGRGLHAVVNNAGIIVQGPLELLPDAELHRQFAVNVYGPARVTREFLPHLRTGRGRIVNLSAPTARTAMPFMSAISASKAALDSVTAALRVELAPWNIPVVSVVPGAIDTAIFTKAAEAQRTALDRVPAERVELYRSRIDALASVTASQHTSTPESVASTIVRAVEARRPRPRYTANTDALLVGGLLARLPTRLRDRVIASATGLTKAAVPTGASR